MGNHRYRMEQFITASGFSELSLPDKPIIEVAGDQRVLIENHLGVKEYGYEKITVQVSFGSACITGHNLELIRMTKEQLVICGNIQCIQLLHKEET